jgi:Na+/H+-dicarboxylate symporter
MNIIKSARNMMEKDYLASLSKADSVAKEIWYIFMHLLTSFILPTLVFCLPLGISYYFLSNSDIKNWQEIFYRVVFLYMGLTVIVIWILSKKLRRQQEQGGTDS